MRILLVWITLTGSLLSQAQSYESVAKDSTYLPHMQTKKWSVRSYSNVAIGFNFFRGGSATVVSAPIGLQLNRRLNDNFYAFTAVSLAPAYVNVNHPYFFPGSKTDRLKGFKSDYFGLNPSVNMGLMYVNDARTFSVSGAISVQRSYYPILPYTPQNVQRFNNLSAAPVYR